jgi:glutathione S-transferase
MRKQRADGSRYLIEKYDKEGKMGGKDEALRNRIRTFIHAAEGTFMVHALAITYARWFSPQTTESSGDLKKLEEGLAINVGKDLDWLNAELEGNRFIAGRM